MRLCAVAESGIRWAHARPTRSSTLDPSLFTVDSSCPSREPPCKTFLADAARTHNRLGGYRILECTRVYLPRVCVRVRQEVPLHPGRIKATCELERYEFLSPTTEST